MFSSRKSLLHAEITLQVLAIFCSANIVSILSFIHMHMPFGINFLFDDTIKVT